MNPSSSFSGGLPQPDVVGATANATYTNEKWPIAGSLALAVGTSLALWIVIVEGLRLAF